MGTVNRHKGPPNAPEAPRAPVTCPAKVLSFAVLLGVFGSAFVPTPVQAQQWLDDRQRREGPGIRVGDFELHPGVGVELGYDSNLFFTSDNPNPEVEEFRDTAILRATAHLLFSTRGQQRSEEGEAGGDEEGRTEQPPIAFRGGVTGSFFHFFNDGGRTNVALDAGLRLTLFPGRVFSATVYNDFSRAIRPFSENTRSGQFSFSRINNRGGLQLAVSTPGQVLQFRLGYELGLDFFEDTAFNFANRFEHRFTLEESYRFLPQTAIVHRTTVRYVDYFADPGSVVSPNPSLRIDGFDIATSVGVNGALTSNFSVLGLVGYGAGFYEDATASQDYESILVQLQAQWTVVENVQLVGGYTRAFQPSFVGQFYRVDRGFLRGQGLIGGAFLLGAEASIGNYEFGDLLDADGNPLGTSLQRSDIRFIGSIFAEYRFTNWLGVNANFRYQGSFTDFAYLVEIDGGAIATDPASFNKFEIFGGVRVFY